MFQSVEGFESSVHSVMAGLNGTDDPKWDPSRKVAIVTGISGQVSVRPVISESDS